MAPIAIAAASLAVTAVGTVASISAQSKAQKTAESANAAAQANADKANAEQKRATELQRQQADLVAARQKRDAIRQARIARGLASSTATNAGASDSSSALGGLGSIESQLGGTLSFLDQYGSMSDQISTTLGNANDYQFAAQKNIQDGQSAVSKANASASMWSQVAGLGMAGFSNSGAISKNIFHYKGT